MHNLPRPDFAFPEKYSTADPDFSRGCFICGAENRALQNNGLERAHIFAKGHVTNLAWNIIPLCPRCHQSFDSLVKPLIANALQYATQGYHRNPSERKYPEKELKKDLATLIDTLRVHELDESELPSGDSTATAEQS